MTDSRHSSRRAIGSLWLAALLLLSAPISMAPAQEPETTEEEILPEEPPLPVERPEPPEGDAPDEAPEEAGESRRTEEDGPQDAGETPEAEPAEDDAGEPDMGAPLPVARPEPPADAEDAEPEADRQTERGEQAEDEAASEEDAERETGTDDAIEDIAVPASPEPEDPAELRACRAALRGLGAVFTQNDEIVAAGEGMDGCGVTAPFAVTEILPDVTLAPATEMRCETALQLARWVKEEVQPAAEALDGFGAVTALNHGSTYVCRPRNNIEDAKISEHAKGNAIDIMSFTFESGETVAVSPKAGDGTPAEVFQKAVGSGACLYFTTVLGPGSDPFHNDHLHLDVVERGSGYRLCQAP